FADIGSNSRQVIKVWVNDRKSTAGDDPPYYRVHLIVPYRAELLRLQQSVRVKHHTWQRLKRADHAKSISQWQHEHICIPHKVEAALSGSFAVNAWLRPPLARQRARVSAIMNARMRSAAKSSPPAPDVHTSISWKNQKRPEAWASLRPKF